MLLEISEGRRVIRERAQGQIMVGWSGGICGNCTYQIRSRFSGGERVKMLGQPERIWLDVK